MSSFTPHATPQRPQAPQPKDFRQRLVGTSSSRAMPPADSVEGPLFSHMSLAPLSLSCLAPLYAAPQRHRARLATPITRPRSIQAGGRWDSSAQRLGVEDLLLQWQKFESVERCGSTPVALATRLRLDSPSQAVATADKESL